VTRREWQNEGGTARVINGDALDVLPTLADASVALIATDPPYHRVKMECEWDRQWKTDADYLAWLGTILDEFRRVLKPNGSLYLFASPDMTWGVEGEIRKRFNWLNTIRWVKEAGWHQKSVKEELRSYLSPYESVIFAEHPCASVEWENGSDGAKAIAFESVRQYLASERDRAGWTTRRVAEEYQKVTGSRTVTGMAGHWFERVQWCLPTAENYAWLQRLFNRGGEADYLRREYEDLRREYEDLRREYEDLRREFSATAEDQYTDVWDFQTVGTYPGKHECEKPADMIRQIVRTSSRAGDTVLDCFAGSGVTGQVCGELGRQVILVEKDEHWYKQTIRRCQHRAPERPKVEKPLPLFDTMEQAT